MVEGGGGDTPGIGTKEGIGLEGAERRGKENSEFCFVEYYEKHGMHGTI